MSTLSLILDLFGNAIADKLDDRASDEASHSRGISSKVINSFALTQKVQHRLVLILEDIVKASPTRGLNRLEIPRPLPLSFFAVRSEHSLIISPGAASCSRCHLGIHGAPSLVKAWMGITCPTPHTQVIGADTLIRPRLLSRVSLPGSEARYFMFLISCILIVC